MPYYEAMANEEAPIAVQGTAEIVGSQAALAQKLNVSAPTVNQWATGKRPVPRRFALILEELSQHKFTRCDFRPLDWMLIWPEFVRTTNQPKEAAHG